MNYFFNSSKSEFTFLQAPLTLFQPFDLVKRKCIALEMKFFGPRTIAKNGKKLSSPVFAGSLRNFTS